MEGSNKMLKKIIESVNIQLVFICFLMMILYAMDISKGELFYNNDETRHAFTGVFIRDLISDLPLNPLQYTYEYYAQYPALGIIHWPPFFYFVESIFYFIFGISVVSGRMAVLFFALIGIIFWYKLVLKMHNKNIAFFSAIILLTSQPILSFSKLVMLEIPALTLSIITIYYFYSYIIDCRRRDIYLCSIFFALSILTKQSAIFLPILFVIYLVIYKKIDMFLKKEVLISIGIFAILIIPYNIIVYNATFSSVSKDLFQGTTDHAGSLFNLDTYLYYVKALPGQVGWVMLVLFVLSILQIFRKNEVIKNSLPLIWIVVCYAIFTVISQKAPRYIIFWIPPILLLAVCFIDSITLTIRKITVSVLILTVISISQVVYALKIEKPYINGYEKAAKYVLEKTDNEIVLFDGYLNANFIFFIRQYDVDRKVVVFRGSKMLYATNIYPEYGISYNAIHQQDIIKIIEDYGIKYIVVEDKIIQDIKIKRVLRSLLKDRSKFKLVNTVNIDSNIAKYKDMKLLIYEYKKNVKRVKSNIELKMHTLGGKDINIDSENLLERSDN